MIDPNSRFVSFAERYIIARAGTFRRGYEQEDAWLALQDAQKVYDMVAAADDARAYTLLHNSGALSNPSTLGVDIAAPTQAAPRPAGSLRAFLSPPIKGPTP
jgi:hypothetical protein